MEQRIHDVIAYLYGPYSEKFGVPRQPGLIEEAKGKIVFTPPFRQIDAFKGLEQFSHIWVLFEFHQIKSGRWRTKVRPPRLGGNRKLGVFATRSPFRPNRIGLSVLRLEKIEETESQGPILWVSGLDLVSGTPIFDIKPYLPYADALPHAVAGFAQNEPKSCLGFIIEDSCQAQWMKVPIEDRSLIEKTLTLDPRPAIDRGNKQYGLRVANYEIRCELSDDSCKLLSIERVT